MTLSRSLQSVSVVESFPDLIRILNVRGIGPRRTHELYQKFGSLKGIFSANPKQLMTLPGITSTIAKNILAPIDPDILSGQRFLIDKFDVQLISLWDDDYPVLLKEIYDPPIVLFCRGNTQLLSSKCLGVVGTRAPTTYGRDITDSFSKALSQQGYTLVSGAAKGVDKFVHQSTLKSNGNTIAVLGNGIDRYYPAENRSLYNEVAEKGLLVSEFLMGTKPDAQNFPRRNRIISGLSSGTLVIEAAEKSGSLITAYFALDQNREVFAVPGNITSSQSKGTHHLIRQGAKLVGDVQDILDEFGEKYRLGASGGQQELLIGLDPKEAAIFEFLTPHEPIQIDDLAQMSNQSTFALLAQLLQMEMKGLIQQLPGKYFKRK